MRATGCTNLHCRIRVATLAGLMVLAATDLRAQPRDEFYWLGEINKASAVMLVEQGIVPKDVAARIAGAVTAVTSDAGSQARFARATISRSNACSSPSAVPR